VLAYLDSIGQDYRTDSTNTNPRWTRNRLRYELLPLLRQRFNVGVDEALLRLAAQAMECQELISQVAEGLADECVIAVRQSAKGEFKSACVRLQIDCGLLSSQPPIVVREVCKIAWKRAAWPLQSMGFDEWRKLSEMMQGTNSTSVTFPANIQAWREGDLLILSSER
jgi:tRNA(Ile)-lysidine synthase